ncbi:MAG: ribonuclease P protein component [Candidatus Aureabacteria bacterium]|nr:ribonuclease P protein component [Candidatus Auribacterota bacterium]
MKQYSLKRYQRLRKEKEFEAVFRSGQTWEKKGFFKARYRKNDLSFSRIGISVSKRAGNSVFRNALKRVVRDWFRMHKKEFSCSFDVVFVFSSCISGYSPESIRQSLDQFLREHQQ